MINIEFADYDDPVASNTKPYTVVVVSPKNLRLLSATQSNEDIRSFEYLGPLNRTSTKNFSVTLNISDNGGLFGVRTFSIIVCDDANIYPLSDGSKSIKVIYVEGYQNSLRDANLGSVYVQDLNDWFRAERTYSIRPVANNQLFNIIQGNLYIANSSSPGSINLLVDVRKPDIDSSAVSEITIDIQSVDSEYVRQAVTIRIQGD